MGTPLLTPDFSLVLGGPLYQLWRGAHLSDDALGHAWGDRGSLPFLRGVEMHVRLLARSASDWISALPINGLTLTMFSLEDLLSRLLQLAF